jgi:hypothetical protein
MILLTFLLACNGCIACQPILPSSTTDTEQQQQQNDTSDPKDTGETGETGIIIPQCPIMDEEPNNNNADAQYVPLEEWICGEFNISNDFDVFLFDFPEEGWLKVWGRGADIGSLSDLILTVDQGSNTAISAAQYNSTDPLLIIPVDEAGPIYAMMQEQYGGTGEENFYELLLSQVKAPIEYNQIEEDDFGSNNSPAGANIVEDGTRVFGRASDNYDTDWYKISLPEGEQVTLTISIESFMEGSPMDPIIYLYPEEAFDSSSTNYVAIRNNAIEDVNNLDPEINYTTDEGGEWAILIENNGSGGSDFHWYVMDISIEIWD